MILLLPSLLEGEATEGQHMATTSTATKPRKPATAKKKPGTARRKAASSKARKR
jgi:hypothetical protein